LNIINMQVTEVLKKQCKVEVVVGEAKPEWYDFMSVDELAEEVQRTTNQVRVYFDRFDKENGGSVLTPVKPFPKDSNDPDSGVSFVLVDKKCHDFIAKYKEKNKA